MKKLTFALVLLAPLVARAEETKLPFNPFEKAQKDAKKHILPGRKTAS